MIKQAIFIVWCFFIFPAFGQDFYNDTNCSKEIFHNALIQHSNGTSQNAPEYNVRAWAKNTMQSADVLGQILKCPEIQSVSDTTTVNFAPIEYRFPNGRIITINYSTQPKVLKQKLLLANKRSIPNGNASPKLMDMNDPAKYIDTEPAWYAIMVVQHDALSEFVGPGKNNTLSVKYINDNIDKIYPHGYYCTSKSAVANDRDTINQVVKQVVDVDGDSNDYYVAGDIDLGWVMYAEITAEILITIATMGAGEAALIGMKSARAAKTASKLAKNVGKLKNLSHVSNYAKSANKITSATRNAERLEKNIQNAKKYEQALQNLEKSRRANNASDIAKYQKQADEILQAAKKTDPGITDDLLKNPEKMQSEIKKINDDIPDMQKELAEWKKNQTKEQIKDIDDYIENSKQLENMLKYRNELNSFRRPQTGNFLTRTLKTMKAANSGAKQMNKAGKVARAGMSSRSAQMGYWLKDSTLKHGARLARFERDAGMLYGAASFLGDMYDYTSDTSKEFSNGIEFKPLCLLSADDLKGQENVVNYGMWLMWMGNTDNPADDDAAYLQAMDFAAKFFYQLDEFQDVHGANCDVDIYVVHPFIRLDETNMNKPSGEMFYLFMNEIPWTTSEQFDTQITDKTEWENNQNTLYKQDPEYKYHKPEANSPEQIATPEQSDFDA